LFWFSQFSGCNKAINVKWPEISLYTCVGDSNVKSRSLSRIGNICIDPQRFARFEDHDSQIVDSQPSALIQSERIDRGMNRSLRGLNLLFRSLGTPFRSIGRLSCYPHGLLSYDPLADCGDCENGSKYKANGFDSKSRAIASFVTACAGIFFVYFGLRTTQYSIHHWRGLFLVVLGLVLSGCGFNLAAYFLYVTVQ